MNRQKYHLFGELLEYPGPRLMERAKDCMDLLAATNVKAAGRLGRFLALTEGLPAGRLEEVYSGTFDLQVVCYPYVGYHLFGESYKRGALMVALKQHYREYGITVDNELPDHLSLVLRYLAAVKGDDEAEELARECLIPALEKMEQGFRDRENPYREIIGALLLSLKDTYPGAKAGSAVGAGGSGGPVAGGHGGPPLHGGWRRADTAGRPYAGDTSCASCFPPTGSEER